MYANSTRNSAKVLQLEFKPNKKNNRRTATSAAAAAEAHEPGHTALDSWIFYMERNVNM